MDQSYFQSSEFKRATGNATDSAIKLFFKWLGIAIKGIAEFIKSLIMSMLGK